MRTPPRSRFTIPSVRGARALWARAGGVLGLLLLTALLASAPASASYEQVGIFAGSLTPPSEPGVFPEEVQLAGASGMAVNVNGVGGVPAGTLYVASWISGGVQEMRVARYNPDRTFSEAWFVNPFGEIYERCGPDGNPATPHCPARAENGTGAVDVDVDQDTGNVFAFRDEGLLPGTSLVTEYSADGSEVIARFGEKAASGETIATSPAKIHSVGEPGGIAVGDSGVVYVFDRDNKNTKRLMAFEPQAPGDYKHYVYAPSKTILATLGTSWPSHPVADAAGDIYVAGEEHIEKYEPGQPVNPTCTFEDPKHGIISITVNPETGEPFFYSYKDKKIHRLSSCNAEGEFTELEAFKVAPERDFLTALAFDPARQFEPTRAPGVLYGAAPGAVPGIGKGEPGQSSLGYVFAQVKEISPEVKAESAGHVTTTTAELGAQIDPRGSLTRYAFQYMSAAAYEEAGESFSGAAEAPVGGAVLGSGQGALSAAAALSGLQADTEYRYRAVASSHCSVSDVEKLCEGAGPAQAFRTFPVEAPGLPDGRVYELVSPVDKHGGQVVPASPSIGSCPDTRFCKPGFLYTHFPMQSTPDGEAIVYEGSPFSPTEGAVSENEYLAKRTASGWQSINLTPSQLASSVGQGFKAFNATLTEGLLEQSSPSLSPEAPSQYTNLYRQPTANPLALSPLLLQEPPNRPIGGAGGGGGFRTDYAGTSADFTRFFFAANDALTGETPFAPEAVDGGLEKSNLYEWAGGELRLVNVAPGNGSSAPGASFGGTVSTHAISEDGSRAFWEDEAGQLYVRENGESTREIPDAGGFLAAAADGSMALLDDGHLYDLESETIADLTEGKGGFQGILGQSEDLSHLFFVDTAVLDETPNERGEVAVAGKYNLYDWQKGMSTFVATLLHKDSWDSNPTSRTAEASPDGRWVAFISSAQLTGYDNTGPCEHTGGGETLLIPCIEAFLYDSDTGKLTCASCNPTGVRPLGFSTLRLIDRSDNLPQPRYLSDSGRLYFDTQDSLSPFDTNNGVEDVYQYEPDGVGSCKRVAGCVALISAGHELRDSNFLTMDESGKNVFFTTTDQLGLKDRDEFVDLYDAREGGGIAAETEVSRGECQGEACQPALVAPNDPTPGSSTFEGAGNVDEGKTAKKHKKKHAKKAHRKRAHKRAAKHNRGGAK